jgi:hypothetical protein
MFKNIVKKKEQRKENLNKQIIVPQFTPEQIRAKKQIYETYIEQMLERDHIPEDEVTDLIDSIKMVLEDCANPEPSTVDEEQETEESIQSTSGNDLEEEDYENEEEEEQPNEDQDTQLSENAEGQ